MGGNAAPQVIEQLLAKATGHRSDAEQNTFFNRVIDAWRCQPGPDNSQPVLTLVAGYAGSGKTKFSRFLCEITGWALLDKDTLTRPLVERLLVSLGGDPHDRHTELYLQDVRPLEYRCLMETAFDNLEAGTSTVVSAPFIAELADSDWVARLSDRCTSRGIDVVVAWVRCDVDSMRKHIELRGDARDTWKLQNWESYASTLNTETSPPTAHITIDNRLGAATYLTDQARDALNRIPLREDAELDASHQRSD
ncbi:AAA family ATPase [Nonomuraea maritima]|uniref:AAA family ATPase n=1 Tax=Nonomuraea maritima TaxID=683260 RepID=UPI001FDFF331|nr:AAA family ATPase [Nonomuraea maritima]